MGKSDEGRWGWVGGGGEVAKEREKTTSREQAAVAKNVSKILQN